MKKILFLTLLLLSFKGSFSQLLTGKNKFTHADSLRGYVSSYRSCYDVTFYHLDIKIDIKEKAISGANLIRFKSLSDFDKIQVDLFENMNISGILFKGENLSFTRDGNAIFISFPKKIKKGTTEEILISYSGNPQIAQRAPWDGGFVFTKDKNDNDWVAVACQGTGASLWWPVKDHQSDEPDSMAISISVPDTLMEISNGRLLSTEKQADHYIQYNWFVKNPINTYDVTCNIGKYEHFSDQYTSEDGSKLSLDYYVMPYNRDKANKQFEQVKPMLKCFEHYFGKYPFYHDGYKLVESPYLGMEHQSAVAYGNKYLMGYLGFDIWGSGEGMKFDYIIIHESAHEWWGNNVTSKDIADMWIHESFATYSEALYLECMYDQETALKYLNGGRKKVMNREPIIGPYDVNKEGSGEMYQKGSLILNTFRSVLNNDALFFAIIKGLQESWGKKTCTTEDVLTYINQKTGKNYTYFFDQYLRKAAIPTLETEFKNKTLRYRWVADIPDFKMPVKVSLTKGKWDWIYPTTEWQSIKVNIKENDFQVDMDHFFIQTDL